MQNQKNILLIDDSIVVHEIVRETFSENSFNLLSAFDGMEGISKLGNNKVDLILLDINLPGYNGFEICKNIKESKYSQIPIIFLTEHGKPKNAIKAMSMGASDFVYKPFNSIELILRIALQLRLKKYQEELKAINSDNSLLGNIIELTDELYNPLTIIEHSFKQLKKSEDNESRETHLNNLEISIERITKALRKMRELND